MSHLFTTAHIRSLRESSAGHRGFAAVLCVAGAATLFVCVRALDAWTTQTNHRVEAVSALGPSTRVLATGSSHVFATINPAHLSVSTMNLAAPVCSYVCVEGILRGNLTRAPNLEALVLEYDVVPLLYDTLEAYQKDYRQLLELEPDIGAMDIGAFEKYELYRDRLVQGSCFAPLFRFGKLTPEQVILRLRGERDSEDAVIGPGYSNGPEVMPADDDGPARVARHVRESPGFRELARNRAALHRIIDLALERDLKMVLMRFPHHPGYWKALPAAYAATSDRELERVREKYGDRVQYWDFGQLDELAPEDYRNGDHINDGASSRVSRKLDARLTKLLGPSP